MKTKAACQLLTPIDDGNEAVARLLNPAYAVQQKFDGKRIILHVDRTSVTAYNRNGLQCEISKDIVIEAKRFSLLAPLVLDSEWIRETKKLYAFDLLEINGTNLRPTRFIDRIEQLTKTLQAAQTSLIHPARTEVEETAKVTLLKRIHELNLEGIVFKHLETPYKIDRDPRQFKYKFTHVSSFIVTKRNEKDSVDLAAYDHRNQLINVGSVKIRNHLFNPILQEGMIVDVRYAHAYPSHKLCQPRMISIRDDLQPESCLLSQLRYKAVNPIAI
jgi:ATP-dependent DNA ligase